jgi:hypothetical protein
MIHLRTFSTLVIGGLGPGEWRARRVAALNDLPRTTAVTKSIEIRFDSTNVNSIHLIGVAVGTRDRSII